MTTLIIVLVIIAVVIAVAAFLIQRKNREANVARADQLRDPGRDAGAVHDRPRPGARGGR